MDEAKLVEIKPGDKVLLVFWSGQYSEMAGTVDQIFPCDGNGCDKHAEQERWRLLDRLTPEGQQAAMQDDPCEQDYLGIVEDDEMVYFRYQVAELNGAEVPGGGG